jgi:undecaprenyl-diphosphatase
MYNSLVIFEAKYLILLVVVIAGVFFLNQDREEKKRMIILGIISFPLAYIFAKIGSHFYFDARPFAVGNFTPLIPHVADNGFPSDHTLLAAAFSSVVYFFNKRTSLWLWILTAFVGISRVLAGVHHIADIVGSMVFAILATALAHMALKRIMDRKSENVDI